MVQGCGAGVGGGGVGLGQMVQSNRSTRNLGLVAAGLPPTWPADISPMVTSMKSTQGGVPFKHSVVIGYI